MIKLFTLFTTILFGAVIGSFLNVVIYRLPKGESVVFPSSHCLSCGTSIRWYDNIPVLSYILLRGTCRTCHDKISPIYPIIETITGLFAGILVFRYGLTWQMISAFTLVTILIVVVVIDMRFMIIPDKLNLFGAGAALLLSFRGGLEMIYRSITGAVIGMAVLWGMYLLGRILFRREGVGLGDVKLAAVMGLFIGPLWIIVAYIISILIGGFWGIFQLVTGKKQMGQEVPFGPFLALGGFFVLFFNKELLYLISMYLSLW